MRGPRRFSAPELVGKPLASRDTHAKRMLLLRCFAVMWIAGFAAVWRWFETIGPVWRGITLVSLVLTAPDIPALFVSYRKHVETWTLVNPPRVEPTHREDAQ